MVITIPDVGLTEQEVRQELALALFKQDRATLAKAANIAGVTRLDFQRLLAERSIPVHYGLTDLADDLHGLDDQYSAAAGLPPSSNQA
jgi:predicted HTH domain antitoxin